jgi:hypothetical protein
MSAPLPLTASPRWTATPDPTLQINSVALSADGNSCVFGTSSEYGDGTFHVYHYDGTGALRGTWPFGAAGSTQGVFWVAVSACSGSPFPPTGSLPRPAARPPPSWPAC